MGAKWNELKLNEINKTEWKGNVEKKKVIDENKELCAYLGNNNKNKNKCFA